MATPIIPWVGFKGWQREPIVELADRIPGPFELSDSFFGGGGSLQALAGHKRLARVEVGDASGPLCDLWEALLRDPGHLRIEIENLWDQAPPKTHFYEVRKQAPTSAAALLYVLLWGFNGLMRFNLKGECNTPIGKGPRHDRPQEAIDRVFARAAELVAPLKRREVMTYIEEGSFEDAFAAMVRRRYQPYVFSYSDPPFVGAFTGYSGRWTQAHLNSLVEAIEMSVKVRKGVYALAGTSENLAHLPDRGWAVQHFSRSSSVSCTSESRGQVVEALAVLERL